MGSYHSILTLVSQANTRERLLMARLSRAFHKEVLRVGYGLTHVCIHNIHIMPERFYYSQQMRARFLCDKVEDHIHLYGLGSITPNKNIYTLITTATINNIRNPQQYMRYRTLFRRIYHSSGHGENLSGVCYVWKLLMTPSDKINTATVRSLLEVVRAFFTNWRHEVALKYLIQHDVVRFVHKHFQTLVDKGITKDIDIDFMPYFHILTPEMRETVRLQS